MVKKKYPTGAGTAPVGYHEFFRKAIKKQDSPWDADLTGSVASTVGTKIAQFFILVKFLTITGFKKPFGVHKHAFACLLKSTFTQKRKRSFVPLRNSATPLARSNSIP